MINDKYLKKMFYETKANALVSLAPQTRLWITGIDSTDGVLVCTTRKNYLFVDGRYIEYAQDNAKNAEVILLEKGTIEKFFAKRKMDLVAIERDYLLLVDYAKIRAWLPKSKFVEISGQSLRKLKSHAEIVKLQRAIDISLKALKELYDKHLSAGMSELAIANKLNYLMMNYGSEKPGFDTIVATGPNSAKPHWHPGHRRLQEGETLKIDFGAQYEGYTADITRTIIYKKNSQTNPEAAKILEIVKEAALRGRLSVKAGVIASEVDSVCRQYIEEHGYGKYFIHSTGHGLGIDVHELPVVSQSVVSQAPLEVGDVITVEPGIYIPGLGGARIEDDLLVTEDGAYVLSRHQELINNK